MPRYRIYLDDFCEAIFHEMERIQGGDKSHIVEFEGSRKEDCACDIAIKLAPFIENQLSEWEKGE